MSSKKITVAIVGCGNIANTYATQIQGYPHVKIAGFFDMQPDRAPAMASKYGGRAYETLAEVLKDDSVDVVVNLTIHRAHAAVIRQCLEAGKHVHTEKPLALSYREAVDLCDLADKKGLRLSSAPSNFMGAAQETTWKLIREGRIGTPRLAYAEVNHGRIESWHPNPEPFYEVGILWDVAVYPLTLLTSFFGPAKRVTGVRRLLKKDRVTKEGRPFQISVPDYALALIDFENGIAARLSANFYALSTQQGGSMEFHGDEGDVFLGDFQNFAAPVTLHVRGKEREQMELCRTENGIEFARGVDELAVAMLANRPQRSTGRQAAHVCEIIEAIERSSEQGKPIEVISTFTPPQPIDFNELSPPAG
jgi:predicted dehydrogenase